MDIHARTHLYSEGWSDKELYSKMQTATKLALPCILAAIALIVLPFIFVMKFSLTLCILLIAAGAFALAVLGATVYWFKGVVLHQDDYQNDLLTFDKGTSVLVFLLAFTSILFNVFLIIFLSFWNQFGLDYYIATEGDPNEYFMGYTLGLCFMLPLLLLLSLHFGFTAFASYITIEDKHRMRACIQLFSVTTVMFGLLSIYYTNIAINESNSIRSPFKVSVILEIFVYLAAIILAISVAVFLSAFLYRSKFFSIFGYLILIFIFLIAGSSFLYFRESNQMRSAYNADCRQAMRNAHQDWVLAETSCQKYLATQSCSAENLAVKWESQNEQACINDRCCSATANSYSKYYYFASFSVLLFIISTFALSTALLQADTSNDRIVTGSRAMDYVLAVLMLAILIFVLFLV